MIIQTPDMGVDKALVNEILVQVGDVITAEQSIMVLESDKASVEVPSKVAGVVKAILVNKDDVVREGVALIEIEAVEASQSTSEPAQAVETAQATTSSAPQNVPVSNDNVTPSTSVGGSVDVNVPDIGVDKALVTEILVKVGDTVELEQSIAVLESDKATVEVPSSVAGVVEAIYIELNQSVSHGVPLMKIKTSAGNVTSSSDSQAVVPSTAPQSTAVEQKTTPVATSSTPSAVSSYSSDNKLTAEQEADNAKVYAGPAVRKLARELGVVLSQVQGTGTQQRILKDDVFAYVKQRLVACEVSLPIGKPAVAQASGLPPLPDFSAFGGGEVKEMTRLQQVSVPQLSLNNFIPQVTQFDLADITELEAWRNELKDGFKKQGISLTILAFIAKAVAHLLLEERYFASHLADDQKSVILRNEIHMGIAVATPDGLTVPVLRNPDQKSIKQIAQELAELSQKARDKKLSPKDLQGANFTITSLGSIGGTAFTPLVNWPQVAILGISPAKMQPVWNGQAFEPRLMLPLSLSYDHRVINGADAARFTNKLTKLLADIRTLLI